MYITDGSAKYKDSAVFLDGNYVNTDDARVSIFDLNFLLSDPNYDVVHVWKGAFWGAASSC